MEMKTQKIMLIDPPFFRFLDENQSSVPLGISYLASALNRQGLEEVIVYNADFDPVRRLSECNKGFFDEVGRFALYKGRVKDLNHLIYREVVHTVTGFSPHLIGVSLRTAKFYIARNLIGLLKEALGGVPIVVGGPHATAEPAHVLLRTPADFVVRGEGEETLPELVHALQGGRGEYRRIAGLSYREGDRVVHNPARGFVPDLDVLPFPNRDALLYREAIDPDEMGNLLSSRGCPFGCSFCDSKTTWSRKVRRRSAKNVVDEIVAIRERYGTAFFSFSDDCFVTHQEHTLNLCKELEERGLARLPLKEFRWWCEVHPRFVSREVVQRMREANCVAIAIGAESGSQRSLREIKKSSSIDLIRKAAQIIREAGLHLTVFFMIGFPWETEEDIQSTISFMRELEPDSGNLSIVTPLPSTEIYQYCQRNGLLDYDEDYLNCFHQRDSHFYNSYISEERSRQIIKDSFSIVDELVEGSRNKKIENFLKEELLTTVLLKLNGQMERRDEQGSPEVACKQFYADKRIAIRVDFGNTPIRDPHAFARELAAGLLSQFPQYLEVAVETLANVKLAKETFYSSRVRAGAGKRHESVGVPVQIQTSIG